MKSVEADITHQELQLGAVGEQSGEAIAEGPAGEPKIPLEACKRPVSDHHRGDLLERPQELSEPGPVAAIDIPREVGEMDALPGPDRPR